MWEPGQLVNRREVLGYWPIDTGGLQAPWKDLAWLELPVRVVEDNDRHLITYIPNGAPFHFPDRIWPAAGGVHPWSGRTGWQGHGVLMMQRPGDHHAVWHFWDGPDRRFSHWYINLQTAFRRTGTGYDTQDLELDIIVQPDGSWILKDDEFMEDRVAEGRFSTELVTWIRALGRRLTDSLDRGEIWWDQTWAEWEPPADWGG